MNYNYDDIDKKFEGDNNICVKTMLTLANRLNSSRAIMFGSQTDQITIPKYAEQPKVFTGRENIVGDNATSFYKAKHDFVVVKKFVKFPKFKDSNYLLLIKYNNGVYDIINKKPGEILTESFGYMYNNDVINSIDEGDTIKKGEVLFKSTSFDENMNYCYGKNVCSMYTTDKDTIEDPIVISESLHNAMSSIEYNSFDVSLNDNEILLNLFGDDDKYKSFPDIGEYLSDVVLAAKKMINYNTSLYHLKNIDKPNLLDDTLYYVSYTNKARVVDISIYYNKTYIDEIRNPQIKKYLKMQNEYTKDVYETLNNIIEGGCKYSDELSYIYRRYKKIMSGAKWRINNSVFSNMIINIIVEKDSPVVVGSKFTGRFGDKGVVAKIVPDEELPITDDGRRVHMKCAILGVGGRNNPGQLYEIELNDASYRISLMLKDCKSYAKKKKILLKYIDMVCPKEYTHLIKKNMSRKLIEDAEKGNIRLYQPPMYGNVTFEQIEKMYDFFGFKPHTVYVEKFGRLIPLSRKMIVGDKYIVKLKHHPKTKTSCRSNGFINSRDLPVKSSNSKMGTDIIPNSAIKFGNMELYNMLMNNNAKMMNYVKMLYSSSVLGRRDIGKLYEGEIMPETLKLNKYATNRNAEIFNIYLTAKGIGYKFKRKSKQTEDE